MRLRHAPWGRLYRFGRAERGSATVEFAIVFPLVLSLLMMGVEMGWTMLQRAMLERALDIAVREVRLGRLPPNTSHAQFKQLVCSHSIGLRHCDETLMVEMQTINTQNWSFPSSQLGCVDRAEQITPVTQFSLGAGATVMYLRACYLIEPIFPVTPLGLQLPLDASGAFAIRVTSAFVNE